MKVTKITSIVLKNNFYNVSFSRVFKVSVKTPYYNTQNTRDTKRNSK